MGEVLDLIEIARIDQDEAEQPAEELVELLRPEHRRMAELVLAGVKEVDQDAMCDEDREPPASLPRRAKARRPPGRARRHGCRAGPQPRVSDLTLSALSLAGAIMSRRPKISSIVYSSFMRVLRAASSIRPVSAIVVTTISTTEMAATAGSILSCTLHPHEARKRDGVDAGDEQRDADFLPGEKEGHQTPPS